MMVRGVSNIAVTSGTSGDVSLSSDKGAMPKGDQLVTIGSKDTVGIQVAAVNEPMLNEDHRMMEFGTGDVHQRGVGSAKKKDRARHKHDSVRAKLRNEMLEKFVSPIQAEREARTIELKETRDECQQTPRELLLEENSIRPTSSWAHPPLPSPPLASPSSSSSSCESSPSFSPPHCFPPLPRFSSFSSYVSAPSLYVPVVCSSLPASVRLSPHRVPIVQRSNMMFGIPSVVPSSSFRRLPWYDPPVPSYSLRPSLTPVSAVKLRLESPRLLPSSSSSSLAKVGVATSHVPSRRIRYWKPNGVGLSDPHPIPFVDEFIRKVNKWSIDAGDPLFSSDKHLFINGDRPWWENNNNNEKERCYSSSEEKEPKASDQQEEPSSSTS